MKIEEIKIEIKNKILSTLESKGKSKRSFCLENNIDPRVFDAQLNGSFKKTSINKLLEYLSLVGVEFRIIFID